MSRAYAPTGFGGGSLSRTRRAGARARTRERRKDQHRSAKGLIIGGEQCGRHRSCQSRPPKYVDDPTEHIPPLASGQAVPARAAHLNMSTTLRSTYRRLHRARQKAGAGVPAPSITQGFRGVPGWRGSGLRASGNPGRCGTGRGACLPGGRRTRLRGRSYPGEVGEFAFEQVDLLEVVVAMMPVGVVSRPSVIWPS